MNHVWIVEGRYKDSWVWYQDDRHFATREAARYRCRRIRESPYSAGVYRVRKYVREES